MVAQTLRFRMAVQNSSYVSNILGVRSFVHRQKIQLKALDVVLFGFHDKSSRLKDIALAALAIGLVSVLILFKAHRNRSRRKMEELASRLSELATMETDFAGAQRRHVIACYCATLNAGMLPKVCLDLRMSNAIDRILRNPSISKP